MNSSSELDHVFEAVASGPSATFTYSGTGCSTWGTGKPLDLCSAEDPGTTTSSMLTTNYTYDTSKSADYKYDLVTVTPPNSPEVINDFNSSGEVCEQDLGSTASTAPATEFAYASFSGLAGGQKTTVTQYPIGKGGTPTACSAGSNTPNTSYYYFSNNALVESVDSNGDISYFDIDPATMLPYSEVDGDGNAIDTGPVEYQGSGASTNTDGMGNITQTAYTSMNEPWCQVDAADTYNGVECPSTEPSTPPSAGSGQSSTYLGATITYYNSAGLKTAETDSLGYTSVTAYTSAGLPYCTVDDVEYSVDGVTCPGTPPTSAPVGTTTGYTTNIYDSSGDLLSKTDPVGDETQYIYGVSGLPGLVSETIDPDGGETYFTYNPAGQVLTKEDEFGSYTATTQYAYSSNGLQYCEVDPYEYSQAVTCPTTAPTSPPTGTPGYTDSIYNSLGEVTTTTNPIGGTTQYAYDATGNKYCTVTPYAYAGGTRCPTSEPSTPPTPSSDPYPGATIDTFNADNQVVQVTNPIGGITLTTYDAAGNVTETETESNNSTNDPYVVKTTTYDSDNRPISVSVDPASGLAQTTQSFYDPNGNVYCSVSANSTAAGSSTYQCPSWQPGWILPPSESSNSFANPNSASVLPSPSSLYSTSPSTTQANNVTTTFMNSEGQVVQTTNADVDTSVTAYDADGRSYCTVDPRNLAGWLASNSTGTYPYQCPTSPPTTEPTQGSNPMYSTTIYNAAGETASNSDQNGDGTSFTYDPDGNQTQVTDADGHSTKYCYYWQTSTCASGASSSGGMADMLYTTTRPDTSADPSGEVTTDSYLPGGWLNTMVTPAATTTYSYDANGDKTGVSYSSGASGYSTASNLSYTFYADGSRDTMTDGTGTTTYSYDDNGDLTSQAFVHASGTGLSDETVSQSYYTTGSLDAVTYPSFGTTSNPAVDYSYDATGTMATVTDWQGNEVVLSHDADGNQTEQKNQPSGGSDSDVAYSYDNADQNSSTSVSGTDYVASGTTILGLTQPSGCTPTSVTLTVATGGTAGSRNADGQLTHSDTTATDSCSNNYGSSNYYYSYGSTARLTYEGTSAQGSSPNNFGTNPPGNLTKISQTLGGSFDTFTQTADAAGEITAQTPISGSGGSSSTFTYDTLGDQLTQTTGSTTQTYGYNEAGQMVSYNNGSTTTSYMITGDGLEASTEPAGASSPSQMIWNGNPSLPLLLADGTNYYIYGNTDTPIEQFNVTSSPPTYNPTFISDVVSVHTTVISNSNGVLLDGPTYDPFGSLNAGTPGSAFSWTGEYTDSLSSSPSNLLNLRARWANPSTGSFTTVDPLVSQTDEPYEYASDDSVNLGDPTGQVTVPAPPGSNNPLACGKGGPLTLSWADGNQLEAGSVTAQGCIYWNGGYETFQINLPNINNGTNSSQANWIYGQGAHGQLIYSASLLPGTINASSGTTLCNTPNLTTMGTQSTCKVAYWHTGYYYGIIWWNNILNAPLGTVGPPWMILQIVGGNSAYI